MKNKKIKEIEKEIEELERFQKIEKNGDEYEHRKINIKILIAKLSVYKEWEKREKEIEDEYELWKKQSRITWLDEGREEKEKAKEILKVKGDKNSFANSEMKVFWNNGLLEINKGFIGVVLSKNQAKKLGDWLNKEQENREKEIDKIYSVLRNTILKLERDKKAKEKAIYADITEFGDKVLNANTKSKSYIEISDFEYHLKELKSKLGLK